MNLNIPISAPFDLPAESVASLPRPLLPFARLWLRRLLALQRLNEIHAGALAMEGRFHDNLLAVLGLSIDVSEGDLVRIPRQGGAVVVANHPFGGVEGIALLSILTSVRPDVRILANSLIDRVPQLREHCFFVDPFGTGRSARGNIRGIKGAMEWVEDGGLLAVFPAGEVSHLSAASGRVADPQWSPTIARIIRRTKAPAVPVYFAGRNGALFQLAGLLHPRLRTALLPRELLNKRGMVLRARIGNAVPFSRLGSFADDASMIGHLRERTYFLRHREEPSRAVSRAVSRGRNPAGRVAGTDLPMAVAPPEDRREWLREIASLPASQHLLSHGEFQVHYASADQIPHLLREIGRLRELAFRSVGEGTGRSLDLDRFDPHYHHLFLFDGGRQEIAGAYRIGASDRIAGWFGQEGLYTGTLFRYGGEFLRDLGPALELGRSFLQPCYQKSYNPLMLLWKGIGSYVARFPRYRCLFGPVSISGEYSLASRRLMAGFLRHHRYDAELGRLVEPRTPMPRFSGGAAGCWSPELAPSLEDLASLVAEMEGDGRGIPVLLRQYLRLGGRLLAFNIDPAFSNVLDALLYVDLAKTERPLLERYMGKEGAEKVLGRA